MITTSGHHPGIPSLVGFTVNPLHRQRLASKMVWHQAKLQLSGELRFTWHFRRPDSA